MFKWLVSLSAGSISSTTQLKQKSTKTITDHNVTFPQMDFNCGSCVSKPHSRTLIHSLSLNSPTQHQKTPTSAACHKHMQFLQCDCRCRWLARVDARSFCNISTCPQQCMCEFVNLVVKCVLHRCFSLKRVYRCASVNGRVS